MPRVRTQRVLTASFIRAYKVAMGCKDCGTRTGRLDLDHRDKAIKAFRVSQARDRKPDQLLTEMLKCDVRCATCHTRRHWAEGVKEPPNGRKRPPCFCGRTSYAKGMCQMHYTRVKRHGNPHVVKKPGPARAQTDPPRAPA